MLKDCITKVSYGEEYEKHEVFETINKMKDYYDGLADTCFQFIPTGTLAAANYSSYVYLSIETTLESIEMLLKNGHITDAFVLIRKLFDTAMVEIYLNVVREDKYDWEKNIVVKDVNDWIRHKIWIPHTDRILGVLKNSNTTKDIYPLFGWESYLKSNRALLDDNVHASSYKSLLANCKTVYIKDRVRYLKNANIILRQIMLVHMSFVFYLNGHYMMAHTHMDYLEMGKTPPEGSQYWLAKYAQDAFDEFIKPYPKIATFVKEHCSMEIE